MQVMDQSRTCADMPGTRGRARARDDALQRLRRNRVRKARRVSTATSRTGPTADLGDSLLVIPPSPRRKASKGRVQMIYMHPPYGIKFGRTGR